MMNNQMEEAESSILHTYNRFPVVFERGEGVHLFDSEGSKYLDFAAGIAVNSLGYHYPGYDEANTPEKWDELLDKMIWSFEQAANYYEIYESIDYNNSDWREKRKKLDDKIQEGLMLFAKWFQHLGW